MKRTKEEYLNLLKETVNYYSEDTSRRGMDDSGLGCLYTTSNGNHCAVGRCLTEEAQDKIGTSSTEVYTLADEFDTKPNKNIDNLLKEEYQGFDIKFWKKLQMLHDYGGNWDEDGLNQTGQNKIEQIDLNHYDILI